MVLRLIGEIDDPVFRSLQGGHLDPAQVHRIVKAAARQAELPAAVSVHWLRHAHASHSLDRGAAIQPDPPAEPELNRDFARDFRRGIIMLLERKCRALTRS